MLLVEQMQLCHSYSFSSAPSAPSAPSSPKLFSPLFFFFLLPFFFPLSSLFLLFVAKAAAIFKAQVDGDKTALMAAMMGSMKEPGGIKPKIHR